jgi:thiol-disulfide isomerase/thioredoxin
MKSPRHFGVREFVSLHARIFACALLLSLAATAASAQGDGMSCSGGQRLSAAELRQGTTLAIFWASWSPKSRDVFERINAAAAKWGGRARVVAINYQEDPQEARRALNGRTVNAPVCFDVDGSFSNSYDVATLPEFVLLRDGAVAVRGRLDDEADGKIAGAIR